MSYPRIVFHHIPKCGGSSLVRGLVLTYYPSLFLRSGKGAFSGALNAEAAGASCEIFGLDPFLMRRSMLAYELARGKSPLLYGHYPFSSALFDRFRDTWAFVTLLRHPVDRWYSEYFYNRYKDHQYASTTLDVEAYLDTAGGRSTARSFVNYFVEVADPCAPATVAEGEAALAAISKLDVVGCLEQLDRFRDRMKARFGRRPIFPHVNRSPAPTDVRRRPSPNSSVHKRLLQFLEADIYIYEQCARHCESRNASLP